MKKVMFMTLLILIVTGFSVTAFAQKAISPELANATAFKPDNAAGSAGETPAPTDTPSTKPNIWLQMLAELVNKVAAVAVPLGVAGFIAWLTKKTGWDIPAAIEQAIEAFILNAIQEIKNQYGMEKDSGKLKMLCVNLVTKTLSNKLSKALIKKFGSVETAVEYYYQTAYKPIHQKR